MSTVNVNLWRVRFTCTVYVNLLWDRFTLGVNVTATPLDQIYIDSDCASSPD